MVRDSKTMNALVDRPISTDRIYVTQNGQDYEHIVEGTLFRKKTRENESTGKVTVVYDQLRDHELALAYRGVHHQEDSREYRYTLVRRTINDQWVYYPLPLVFNTLDERVRQGKRTGTQVPCARWVRRQRGRISDYLLQFRE